MLLPDSFMHQMPSHRCCSTGMCSCSTHPCTSVCSWTCVLDSACDSGLRYQCRTGHDSLIGSEPRADPRCALFQCATERRGCAPQVEQLLSGEGSRAPTFAKIHGNNTDVIKAADLDLMRCLATPTCLWRCMHACMGVLHLGVSCFVCMAHAAVGRSCVSSGYI